METMVELLAVVMVLVIIAAVSVVWGEDSRDGFGGTHAELGW